ncbi:hypothetical protein GQ600_24901 [Phytophthora cactorum]|nr:hypothetical protein GQ600_24901 [Phytophthora cactorum]
MVPAGNRVYHCELLYGLPVYEQQEKKKKKQETRKMAKGSTTVPATPSKSGGARKRLKSGRDGCTLAAVSELSVSFEDEENMVGRPR